MQISALAEVLGEVERIMARVRDRPAVVGLCGSQGSGKTTLAAEVARHVPGVVVLSLDDVYLPLIERKALADAVHPLLRTRGVPGTHDIALAMRVLAALEAGEDATLPRFDKARDDRAPVQVWPVAKAPTALVLLEGWCVGARPQNENDLAVPANELERLEDPDQRWRRYVNRQLAGSYQTMFGRLDALILLAAPDFDTVLDWRIEQENALRARSDTDAPGIMDDAAVGRFIQHYERLTRSILAEMPERADLTVWLDRARTVVATTRPKACD